MSVSRPELPWWYPKHPSSGEFQHGLLVMGRLTPPRGEEIGLKEAFEIQGNFHEDPRLIEFQKGSIETYLDPARRATIYRNTPTDRASITTFGRLKPEPNNILVIGWNQPNNTSQPNLWIGKYTPFEWTRELDSAEINIRSKEGYRLPFTLRDVPELIHTLYLLAKISFQTRSLHTHLNWASEYHIPIDPAKPAPVMGLRSFSHAPALTLEKYSKQPKISLLAKTNLSQNTPIDKLRLDLTEATEESP